MTDLLSAEDRAEFFGAIRDVTDTFYKDSCQYLSGSSTFSEFDEGDRVDAAPVTLPCRVTPLDKTESESKETEQGAVDPLKIEIRFNAQQIEGSNSLVFESFKKEVDYFNWKNSRYKLLDVTTDDSDFGQVSGPGIVIIVCTCKREEVAA